MLASPPLPGPVLRWSAAAQATLVLGRAQPSSHVQASAVSRLGVEVVRRASGGSAVLLQPGRQLWADLVVPAGDPLWDDDIGRAVWWVGEAWAATLASFGVAAEVHRGAMARRVWGDRVCFAGLGAGEVSVGGRKIVGVAQRRTRSWAWFQCALLLHWEPGAVAELLGVEADLTRSAVGLADLGVDATPGAIEVAFVNHLR